MKRKQNRHIFGAFLILAVCGMMVAVLLYNGVIHLNDPGSRQYPVRGVDVSAYQGEISWPVLASQGIDFAFIKATEGSDYVDEYFAENLSAALETGLQVGAYHFFTGLSPGKAQAENFIRTVPKNASMLPPAVDVEFCVSLLPLSVGEVRQELRNYLESVTAYYGKNPIIYVTKDSYEELIRGAFDDYDIWYRSVYRPAQEDVDWTFWQYSNRHRLKGYAGKEKFIDMNVFHGSRTEWEAFVP